MCKGTLLKGCVHTAIAGDGARRGEAREPFTYRELNTTLPLPPAVIACMPAHADAPDIAHQACQAPDSGPAASSSAPARGSAGGQRAAAMPQSQALPAFLQWACGLVLDELPRRPAAAATEAQQQQPLTALSHNTASVLSVGHRRLGWDALLAGRRVQAVAVAPALAGAPAGTGLVCCAYSPVVAAQSEAALHDHSLRSLGCLCVWDARAPAAPLHVLLCEGAPRSCCWGAGPCTDVVVAGEWP